MPRRFVYEKIKQLIFEKGARTLVLYGLRGIGKTILMLQIAERARRLAYEPIYLRGDKISVLPLSPYEVLSAAAERYDILLVDEAHYIERWGVIAKVLHDDGVRAMYTGSATIAYSMNADLARRAIKVELFPLSFQEHLAIVRGASDVYVDIVNAFLNLDVNALSDIAERYAKYAKYLPEYLEGGGFAFFHDPQYMELVLDNVMNRAVLQDLINANYRISTAEDLRRVLVHLATARPGGVSMERLAQVVGGKGRAYQLVEILQRLGIIISVPVFSLSGPVMRRKDPRIYFSATAIYTAIRRMLGLDPDLGVLRETAVANTLLRLVKRLGGGVFYPKGGRKEHDFVLRTAGKLFCIEVGGRSKGSAQLPSDCQRIVVRQGGDLDVRGNTLYIPLWLLLFIS